MAERKPLWDESNGLYTHFDAEEDILYLSRGPAVDSYARISEHDERFWFRYSDADDSKTGVTIFGARKMQADDPEDLAKRVADFLGVGRPQVLERIGQAIPS